MEIVQLKFRKNVHFSNLKAFLFIQRSIIDVPGSKNKGVEVEVERSLKECYIFS